MYTSDFIIYLLMLEVSLVSIPSLTMLNTGIQRTARCLDTTKQDLRTQKHYDIHVECSVYGQREQRMVLPQGYTLDGLLFSC